VPDLMRPPNDIVAEARAAFDRCGEILAASAPSTAPGFMAHVLVIAGEALDRHWPTAGGFCGFCDSQRWPCPDLAGWLKLFAIPLEEEQP